MFCFIHVSPYSQCFLLDSQVFFLSRPRYHPPRANESFVSMTTLGTCCNNPPTSQFYECCPAMQYGQLCFEVRTLEELFNSIYAHFLSAIDHMEYHLTQRSNQHEWHSTSQPYCWQYADITLVEAQFIDDMLYALQSINPPLHDTLRRWKRFTFLSYLLGWGVSLNACSIQKIKCKIKKLQEQNEHQQDQILELAYFLSFSMVLVTELRGELTELDTYLNALNYTLVQTIETITNLRFTLAILTDMCTSTQ